MALLLPVVGIGAWKIGSDRARAAAEAEQAARAEQAFRPVLDELSEAAREPEIDIDATIRVMHAIDLALRTEQDLPSYLRAMARQDYRRVAPEVLEARAEILAVLQPLYAKQTELEDQQELWELTSELLLATLSVVSVEGKADLVAPSGAVSVDRAQAQALWEDVKSRRLERRDLARDVAELEEQLVDALVRYADTYHRYREEWESLSVLRDRAYLAAYAGDWAAARASAELAVARAPHETEAHLLLAMAMIEQGDPEERQAVVELLDAYVAEHPDHSAPALLLLGVTQARAGDGDAARLALQQAAAYYPKQAESLVDMLDPYRQRAFLAKSREGSFILELYESTMLGAGYFSPDLQLAKLAFDAGDFPEGKAKVLDHFARRRAQQQWDFVLSDLHFCEQLLGPSFWQLFPEDHYLDLEVSPSMIGEKVELAVTNRSPRTLHNATLVLALHVTDMFPGQYAAVPAPATVPAVMPHDRTSFGSMTIAVEHAGQTRGLSEVVQHRAILISDEAVAWVDTDAFKMAEAEAFRRERREAVAGERAPVVAPIATQPVLQRLWDRLASDLAAGPALSVEQRYGADDVVVELPRELAVVRPTFRLRVGEQVFEADVDRIEGDHIELRFDGVANFDALTDPQDLELVVTSGLGEISLLWGGSGVSFAFEGARPR